MKFPVLFRILAVFNILGSLLILFLLIAMATSRGALINVSPHLYTQLWLIALWMLAISFAWFFASRQAYGMLIINFIAILAMAVIFLLMGWDATENRPSEKSAVIIMAVVPAVYSLFSLFGLFYKPIREWANNISPEGILKTNSGVLITALVTTAAFIGAGFALQLYKPNEHPVVSCQTVFTRDNNESSFFLGNYPHDFKPGENIDIPLTDKACFDAIKISAVSDDYRPWTSARMVDAEGKEQQLSFSREGEFYVAKVKSTCSDRITIYTTTDKDSSVYSVATLQLVRYYSLFEDSPSDYVAMMPGGSDEEYIVAEEGGYGEPMITQENVQSIIERGMNILLREVDWNFEEVVNDDKGWLGPEGVKVGVFAHGLAGLREITIQTFSDYLDRDYSETTITSMLGRPLFDESPELNYELVSLRKVNPETITWIANNFIPSPSTQLNTTGNPTLLKVYEENFQRLARLLVETRQYLYHNTDIGVEKAAYEDAIEGAQRSEEGFHGPSWLQARYENLFLDQYGPEYTQGTFDTPLPPLLVGFWLRREMDGSSEAIWSALGSFMMQYDPGWYMKNVEYWDGMEGD